MIYLLKIFGYLPTIFFGDSAVFDRWMWLRHNLKAGPLRTMDAGCGSGAFAFYAAKCGNEVIGISFDERNNIAATERARILGLKNTKFITFNLNDLAMRANELGKFDQIICFETIEHIIADRKLIHNFSNLLKPGGRLLLTAPYLHYNAHLLGDDKTPLSTHEDGGHVRLGYTHEGLEVMLRESGMIVVKKDYISGVVSQYIIVAIRILSGIIPAKIAWAITLPLRILVLFDGLVTWVLRHPYLSVGVVAQKTNAS